MEFIPRTMSTQHPDNVHVPFFSTSSVLGGDDEIKEAYYVFSHLDCQEQLFDYEGKEADNFIIKKLLLRYPDYFFKKILGRDRILSFRIPNPTVEKTEAKIVIEVLNTIPRYFDTAMRFYKNNKDKDCIYALKKEIAPINQVYVPMVRCPYDIIRVAEYYKKHVAGVQNQKLVKEDVVISKWLGTFRPETIRVTPLVEDMDSMLKIDKITEEYIKSQNIKDYQRVWLARSDPALNYSSLSAILLNKLALQKLHILEEKMSVDIFPIFGCGSSPFRGNFRPETVNQIMKGYPSLQTYTLQSSFKYDNPLEKTKEAIETINTGKRKKPLMLEEKRILEIVEKVSIEYKKQIRHLAGMVNKVSQFVPDRRKRKLHVGLFGYSRASEGIKLPRAIKFCAAFYSFGIPAEILGMNGLSAKDIDYLKQSCYQNMDYDLRCALKYLNKDNLKYLPDQARSSVTDALKFIEDNILEKGDLEIDEKHKEITSRIMNELRKDCVSDPHMMQEEITNAASIRGFIG
ncbi:MAG: phosphoenolpyruvate carboxylase [Candidatus Woesearchaeota archaeon]